MHILLTEPGDYSPKALAIYRKLGAVHFLPTLHGEAKKSALMRADVLAVRLGYAIDEKWFCRMPNLKIIATPTTGLNHIDLKAAGKRGIKIFSLRGRADFLKNIPSTAEETMGLILGLVRKLPWAFEDVKKGRWDRDRWKGHQLAHKTLGIVGCGRLGKITDE